MGFLVEGAFDFGGGGWSEERFEESGIHGRGIFCFGALPVPKDKDDTEREHGGASENDQENGERPFQGIKN